jgi:hypothetical protein
MESCKEEDGIRGSNILASWRTGARNWKPPIGLNGAKMKKRVKVKAPNLLVPGYMYSAKRA